MVFEERKCYRFKVESQGCSPDGRYYLRLSYPGEERLYRVRLFDFQANWSERPYNIECVVHKVFNNGDLHLLQRRANVLSEAYMSLPTETTMRIVSIERDDNTQAPYLLLTDMFGLSHRYYIDRSSPYEASYRVGGELSVLVQGIREIPHFYQAYLELEDSRNTSRTSNSCNSEDEEEEDTMQTDASAEHIDRPRESTAYAFVSSLTYPANADEPDLERQIAIVCRIVSGFMNADGGILFLGVKGDGTIRGIEADMPSLSSLVALQSDNVSFRKFYEQSIRQAVKELLGGYADTLIDFSFVSTKDRDSSYCKVFIKKALVPIFYRGTLLYLRTQNGTELLRNDAFIQHILRCCASGYDNTLYLKAAKEEEDAEVLVLPHTESVPYRTLLLPHINSPLFKEVNPSEKVMRYALFLKDGSTAYHRERPQKIGDDVIAFLPITRTYYDEHYDLYLCYENGCVNKIDVSEMRARLESSKPVTETVNGWNNRETLVNIFCLPRRTNAHLALYTEQDNILRVKLMPLKEITRHGASSLRLQGNRCTPPEAKVLLAYPIDEPFAVADSPLCVTSQATAGKSLYRTIYRSDFLRLKHYIEEVEEA